MAASCRFLSFADEVLLEKSQNVSRNFSGSHGAIPWYPGETTTCPGRCGVAPRPEDDHDCEDYEAVDFVDHELFEDGWVAPGTYGVPMGYPWGTHASRCFIVCIR